MAMRADRCASRYGRRSILGRLFGLALTPLLVGAARREEEVETTNAVTMPPQLGDHFVFLSGANKGQVVRPDNLTVGGPQVQVFPASPDGTIRNGTPLNLMILARFDPADLSEETRLRAAEGVVAYSAVCTHQACPVNMWSKARDGLVCSCHGSVYDPKNGAAVLDGPAPRPLPSLAVKIEDGAVAVASGFSSRVGGTQK
jgi:rieske iron-sulfur protein